MTDKQNDTQDKRLKLDGEAITGPVTSILTLDELEAMWTRDRSGRATANDMKFRSIQGGEESIRGGDFVLSAGGAATTLSFCFEHGGSKYGLTAGHLALIKAPVYAFFEDNPTPTFEAGAAGNVAWVYKTIKIGEVVSKSYSTDSLVFRIQDEIKTDLLKLSPKAGLNGDLVLPDPELSPSLLTVGTVLVGYGAQRRGCIAQVSTPALANAGRYSLVGDIGIASRGNPREKLTDYGDSGTLFLDSQSGEPVYFHHVYSPATMESMGVPFAKVLACHSQLGGTSENGDHEEEQSAGSLLTPSKMTTDDGETYDIMHFKTMIVPDNDDEVYDIGKVNVQVVQVQKK